MYELRQGCFALAATLLLGTLPSRAGASEGFPDRFNFVLGDLRPGSGLAAGAEYLHSHFASGFFDLRLGTRVSIRLYQQHEAEIGIPHFFNRRLFVQILGVYRSYTEVDYFGIGPDAEEDRHADYHIEGPALFATLGFRPATQIAVGGRLGKLDTDLHSGRSGDIPSVEEVFTPSELPGYFEEPDYFLLGGFAAVDLRNDRFDPTRGAYYEVQATRYRDRGFDRFDFDEISIEAQHFVPAGRRLTYASRVKGVFTRTRAGQEIPFYLLPSLGGTTSLHAFENDRFRDRNLVFINNELRYQTKTPEIRLEAFVDVGQVFPDANGFRLSRFELSSGVGIRYKLGRKILVGGSLGIGREGMRVSIKGDFRF